ncbi:MAG: thioredoxin family protein [Bacilli bacterium]|nr:thioredoxin family protein [Bacilli bacterium]
MKIIKISAIWCPACIITNNALNKLKDNYSFELEELDYDFDDIESYKVGDILPVLIFVKDDKEIDRLVGEKNYKEIEEVLKKYE